MSLFGSKKQNEIDKLINENDDLKNQLHSVLLKQGGYEELENNLLNTKKELTEAALKLEALNKDVSSLETGKAAKEKYLGDVNSKILDLEEIKDNLNRTIQSYESQVSLLEDRSKELDEKLSHSTEVEIKLADLKEKKEKLNFDIADKEQAFAYLSTIEREIQIELEKERTECNQFKNQVESLQNHILELNADYEERQRRLEKIILDEETILQRITGLNNDETRKIAEIKTLEERISLNEEIKSNLETNLNNFISQFNHNEKLYHEQSAKKETLTEEIAHLRKERDELENKLNFAKEQFEVFQSEAARHTGIISTLGDEIRKIEILRDTLQSEVDNLNSSIEKQSAEIGAVENKLEALGKRKSDLEEINLNIELDYISIIDKFSLELKEALNNKEELDRLILEKRSETDALESTRLENISNIAEQEGLIRLLKKEKAILEKFVADNTVEKNHLIETMAVLRDNISKNNSLLTSLHYENESLHIKKSGLQRDLSLLMVQISKEYGETENKLSTLNEEVSSRTNILNELNSRISLAKEELKNLSLKADEEAAREKPAGNFFKLTEFEKNADDIENNDNLPGFGINPLADGLADD